MKSPETVRHKKLYEVGGYLYQFSHQNDIFQLCQSVRDEIDFFETNLYIKHDKMKVIATPGILFRRVIKNLIQYIKAEAFNEVLTR